MIKLESKIAGFYKIEAVKEDGSKRVLADWFPNLITNGGLDQIAVSTNYLNYCHVGSGNSVPANTDTSLDTWIAYTGSKTETNSNSSTSPYYHTIQCVYSFGIGAAAGNLSEVGIGWATTNTNLFSRALILDSLGSPTTITVLADEYLYVTYQLRRYIAEVDTNSVVTIAGVDYTFTGRAANVTSTYSWEASALYTGSASATAYDGSIGAITSVPSGTNSYSSSYSWSSYISGNYYRDLTITFDLDDGNVGGISALTIESNLTATGFHYQFGVTPDIPKTADDILELTFRLSWSRH